MNDERHPPIDWGRMLYELRRKVAERTGGFDARELDGATFVMHPEDYAEFQEFIAVLGAVGLTLGDLWEKRLEVLAGPSTERVVYVGLDMVASVLIPEGMAICINHNRPIATVNMDCGLITVAL